MLQHLKRALGQNEEQVNAWYRHWIADGLAKFEADLRAPGRPERSATATRRRWPTAAWCRRCSTRSATSATLRRIPTTMRVFAECMKLEAFDRAQPAKQPDAE